MLTPVFADFIRRMPKVELHVHLEGAVQPEFLLNLAQKHGIALPASTVEGLREWYSFRDFPHFVEIYLRISECIRTPEDIEALARSFLQGQAAQNIRYTEATYTAFTHYAQKGIPFDEQLDALNRARAWGKAVHGTEMGLVIDIPRNLASPEQGMMIAEWAVSGMGNGVVALGLGGAEVGYPPEMFHDAFAYAREQGLPGVPHAGETMGADSVWGALESLGAVRIGHGVRSVEDPALVNYLRTRQIPLEVCPSSNVCLGVVPSLQAHMLPHLLEGGLYVTINSDDPPMFNTSLTDEYLLAVDAFGLHRETIKQLALNAVNATLLSKMSQTRMHAEFTHQFTLLEQELGLA